MEKLQPTTRHYIRVVAFVVLGLSLVGLLMVHAYPYLEIHPIVYNRGPQPEKATTTPSLSRAFPVKLTIPALNLSADFEAPLELNDDKTIEVPHSFDKVGWYKLGAAPGEIGTASILGHVDSYQGAAVFYLLGQLKAGDRIEVLREDGTTAVFEVEYFERYKQEEFPNEKVYTPTEYPSLRLITCTGIYQHGVQRYTHNLVVYARYIES
jgi:hypothetical protein